MRYFCYLILILLLSGDMAHAKDRFVFPSQTDAAIDDWNERHYTVINTAVTPRNQLFVFFAGTGGLPRNYQLISRHAADLGFHVINLRYPNDDAVNALCRNASDPACYEQVRLEIIDGTDRSDLVDVDRPNSVENRLVKLLQYLDDRFPTEGWNQYLDDQNEPVWATLVVGGHSQGGGHAGILGKTHKVDRVVMFAAIDYDASRNEVAPWISQKGVTPPSAYYGLGHERDILVPPGRLVPGWEAYGMAVFGPVTSVDTQPPPYGNSHMLMTNADPKPGFQSLSPYHNSMVVDVETPLTQSGALVFADTWTYLLTGRASSVALEEAPESISISLTPNHPNPFSTTTTLTYTLPQAAPTQLSVYDLLGRRVALLVDAPQAAGQHTVRFDASRLPAGGYVYQLRAGAFRTSRMLHVIH
ncbi:MAG TPA: T9SS type A sorting domain-containing protein [Rhodothermales bacterium]|nr:T9SS type A sorting domain-containing protein [Rhodothermales bacterium]